MRFPLSFFFFFLHISALGDFVHNNQIMILKKLTSWSGLVIILKLSFTMPHFL